MKVHCCRRWWEKLTPSGSGGAAKEGESMCKWEKAVGEGRCVSLEGIMMVYGEVTCKEAEGGVRSRGEE